MVNIDMLQRFYFCNSFTIPYQLKKSKNEINIKPILVKDYPMYEWCKEVLEFQKNETNDINVIKMSYLDFLIDYVFKKDKECIQKLLKLFELCLGETYISFEKDNGRNCIALCEENGTIKGLINRKEFDDISLIILNQNDANYDNRYITPEVKELMYQYYKIKYSDIATPSFEKRKAFVSSKLGKTFIELNEIPYREFDLIYKASVDSEIYLTTKITEASYKYEVKEQTKHPLFEKYKDPYSEIFEDTNVLSSKGINGVQQLNTMNINS